MKYRKKPVVIEAITFDELVEYGKKKCANALVNGMPWSFNYDTMYVRSDGDEVEQVHPITHESDDCYLIPTAEGTMRFHKNDMLITGVKGEIYPCNKDIFEATYERVEE